MSVCTISSTSSSFRLPLFLAPAFAEAAREFRRSSSRSFSTSPLSLSRRTTGPNKERGVSAIRGKNPKPKSRVYQYPLPVPVIDPERRALFKTREDHGLWGFFNKKRESMIAPAAESSHGREWTIAELNGKSFHDLHKLYWTCILEMNQISTRAAEMQRMRAGFGISESKRRKKMVKLTMMNIRSTLNRRHQNWLEARAIVDVQDLKDINFDEAEEAEYEDGADDLRVAPETQRT